MRRTVLAAALALTACGGGDEDCAVPTCIGGLSVVVANLPPQAYRVEVLPAGQATPRAQDCSGGNCVIFFPGLIAAQVTVTVVLASSGSAVTSLNASPAYSGSASSSAACSFDCRTGTVSL